MLRFVAVPLNTYVDTCIGRRYAYKIFVKKALAIRPKVALTLVLFLPVISKAD
jgi:hypothetical protein